MSVMSNYRHTVVAREILSHMGHTPMLVPKKIWPVDSAVKVFAKAEWTNPSGSVKARPALEMILQAESTGDLRPGKVIIDATSGNTGLAYAVIGAARGYEVDLVMPASASVERKRLARIYGARIIESPPEEGIDGAIRLVRSMVESAPDRYFHPDQYSNPANWLAHYKTTGPEIWAQTEGRVTHFVAGVGTGGTLMGAGRRLRELNPEVKIVSVHPASERDKIPGLKHLPTSIVPPIYDPLFPDESIEVTEEEAFEMALTLAREEGWFVGPSGGAAMVAALRLARSLESGVVVTVLPDDGSKYLSLMEP